MHPVVERVTPARLGRPFRWLLASSWVTNLGDGIEIAAGPLLVASLTRDPLLISLAPFWFAFAGSAAFVVLLWPQLSRITHD